MNTYRITIDVFLRAPNLVRATDEIIKALDRSLPNEVACLGEEEVVQVKCQYCEARNNKDSRQYVVVGGRANCTTCGRLLYGIKSSPKDTENADD